MQREGVFPRDEAPAVTMKSPPRRKPAKGRKPYAARAQSLARKKAAARRSAADEAEAGVLAPVPGAERGGAGRGVAGPRRGSARSAPEQKLSQILKSDNGGGPWLSLSQNLILLGSRSRIGR